MTTDECALLDDLLNLEQGLTKLEIEFIDGLDTLWRESDLTEPQKKHLHWIALRMGLEAERVARVKNADEDYPGLAGD